MLLLLMLLLLLILLLWLSLFMAAIWSKGKCVFGEWQRCRSTKHGDARIGVVVCVCGCGSARPADLRSKSVSHVDERNDNNNSDSDVLVITVVALMAMKAFQCSQWTMDATSACRRLHCSCSRRCSSGWSSVRPVLVAFGNRGFGVTFSWRHFGIPNSAWLLFSPQTTGFSQRQGWQFKMVWLYRVLPPFQK